MNKVGKTGLSNRSRRNVAEATGTFTDPSPFPAQPTIPIHENSSDREQRDGQSGGGPDQLDAQPPIRAEVPGGLRPDDPIAEALVHSVAPGGNIVAAVRIEEDGVHVLPADAVAPSHQHADWRSAAIREVDATERGARRDGLRLLDQRVEIGFGNDALRRDADGRRPRGDHRGKRVHESKYLARP